MNAAAFPSKLHELLAEQYLPAGIPAAEKGDFPICRFVHNTANHGAQRGNAHTAADAHDFLWRLGANTKFSQRVGSHDSIPHGNMPAQPTGGKAATHMDKQVIVPPLCSLLGGGGDGIGADGRGPIDLIVQAEKLTGQIRSMITAFGTGIGEDFDINKLRYHKIVIMTDADVDGGHIRILMLTFLYRYLKPLIEGGFVYAAQPPLYLLKHGKEEHYLYSDEELDDLRTKLGEGAKYSIQRYKGLGEMNADQLWETTMDPEHRILNRIELDEAMEADMIFDVLMGEKVEPRREFIQENAKYVTDLDI